MSHLTAKWKAGELEKGFYYLRTADNRIIVEKTQFLGDKIVFGHYYTPSFIKEVLAPVPSYQHLQQLEAQNDVLNQEIRLKIQAQALLQKNIEELNDRVKLLESALKYSNSTVKMALPLIKTMYDSRIIEEVEEMLKKTDEVLNVH